MNTPSPATPVSDLMRDLRSHVTLCEDVLSLLTRESQTLVSSAEYAPSTFAQGRKDLLERLSQSLNIIRRWREVWQTQPLDQRVGRSDAKKLFHVVQDLLVRILILDRENQQAMLRRGLLPAGEVPSAVSQKPNYVANLYRRHASA
jgi:hypothetical protein